MTDDSIEQKARDMVRKEDKNGLLNFDAAVAALCRAIEQHEAFKQEVSDTLQEYKECFSPPSWHRIDQFIIPKPKPDPLVEAMEKMGWYIAPNGPADAENFRAALDALGFEIRKKNDDPA